MTTIVIFWAAFGVHTVCARSADFTVCDTPSAVYSHDFGELPPGDYSFTIENAGGVSEAAAYSVKTPLPDTWKAKYDACSLSNYQLNDLVGRLRKQCGKKCSSVR